jgi:Mn-dependent DtxR family transcriptional regulator
LAADSWWNFMDSNDFRTFSGYMKKEDNLLTASIEDYLEMICRLSMNTGFTRISELSEALNVHPPSATRMVQRLGELNLIQYERYGVILLKEDGRKLGEFLLRRHNMVESFLSLLGIPEEQILTETEKMEHTISENTVKCFEEFISFIKDNPDVIYRFQTYKIQINENT